MCVCQTGMVHGRWSGGHFPPGYRYGGAQIRRDTEVAQFTTGRYATRREPNIQNLSPPMTDEEKAFVSRVREAIWRHLTDHQS